MTNIKSLIMALEKSANRLGGKRRGELKYGWHNKSVGSQIEFQDGHVSWLRVHFLSTQEELNRSIERIENSNLIEGVHKPVIEKCFIDSIDAHFYGAIVQDYIEEETCSRTPCLDEKIEMTPQWLTSLAQQLISLAQHKAEYVSCRQDLITRRITERFGDVPSVIDDWGTIHGDLNWTNVTRKMPVLLDWEGWGQGPRGLDIHFLYAYALLQPDVADLIRAYFKSEFDSPHGKICLLFVCAELMRMVEIHGDHPQLYDPLDKVSRALLVSH